MSTKTLEEVINEASVLAEKASLDYQQKYCNGEDAYPCGFAWVNIYEHDGKKIRANSKMGKALKSMGIEKSDYEKSFRVHNPGGLYVQNVDIKYAGAKAYAEHLKQFGFTAYASERLD